MTEHAESETDQPANPFEDPHNRQYPQELFRMMRDFGPVTEIERSGRRSVMVAKHEDVLSILRDPQTFSSNDEATDIGQVRPLIPLQIDPPDHTKYRKLTDPLFSPKRVAEMEAPTRELVRELVDSVAHRGRLNFHSVVAEPIPSTVFLRLLGLPTSRTNEFLELKDGIIRPPVNTPEERTTAVRETGDKIYEVLEEIVDARLAEPRDDLISGFLASEVDGERLSKEDVLDIGYLFFLAGLDTVSASLDCMIAFLALNPDHRKQIVDDPSLIPAAIEELLRWESPVGGVVRIAMNDTELSGCPISKGATVTPMLGSANTDERFWENGDIVDFNRPVNKHLAFGGGLHRCLGSHLARMELRVVLEEWHRQVPDYHIAPGIELDYTPGLRQVNNLELEW